MSNFGVRTGPQKKDSWVCKCGTLNVGTRICANCGMAIDDTGRVVDKDEVIPPSRPFPGWLMFIAILGAIIFVGLFVSIAFVTFLGGDERSPNEAPQETTTTVG